MGSDHLPILITLTASVQGFTTPKTTHINFHKADWELFTYESERLFQELSDSEFPTTETANRSFGSVLISAAKTAIPAGRRKTLIPHLNDEIKSLISERDVARSLDPQSENVAVLNERINKAIATEKRSRWRSFVESIDPKDGTHKIWRVIKSLDDKPNVPKNCPITFGDFQGTRPADISKRFNKMFGNVSRHFSDPDMRNTVNTVKKGTLNDAPDFSEGEVGAAIS